MREYQQDMPPPGGYAPINYKYVPLKQTFGARTILAIGTLISIFGWYRLFQARDKVNNEKIEMRCSDLAMRPLLEAEGDRALLKQLKRNRDAEERIMKDVEGWEVGKWKNERVFITVGPDEYFRPIEHEYYAHTPLKDYINAKFIFQRT